MHVCKVSPLFLVGYLSTLVALLLLCSDPLLSKRGTMDALVFSVYHKHATLKLSLHAPMHKCRGEVGGSGLQVKIKTV